MPALPASPPASPPGARAPLSTIAREWTRLGLTGFGGPPAHIHLLRSLCVERRGWVEAAEFEDAVAACNLLPGPASTQLAIYCARRAGGWRGAIIGGLGFIVPGLIGILILAALLLGAGAATWALGAGAAAGAVVPAIAVSAGRGLTPASRERARTTTGLGWWWTTVALGAAVAALAGPWVALVLLGCGAAALLRARIRAGAPPPATAVAVAAAGTTAGGALALGWTALKVGALSYGGGFVIVPLMQADAIRHHWLTATQFLSAVALGQLTPGPVVQTVAVVGYGAAGVAGGIAAAAIAFSPSFVFVLVGGRHFDRFRGNVHAQTFLTGAGPAAIGAILGSAIPLALAFREWWQIPILAGAAVALLAQRSTITIILAAAALGIVLAALGAPVPH